MKAHLMYQDRDFDNEFKITQHEQILTQDLELNILFDAMANGDRFIMEVSKKVLFSSLNNSEDILYRQSILKDCIKNPTVVREIYSIVIEAIERKKKSWWGIPSMFVSSLLNSSVDLLQMFVEMLKKIRNIVDEHAVQFQSKGFRTLFTMLQEELNDAFFSTLEIHLNELKFRDGILISAKLGEYNQGIHYVLHRQQDKRHRWLKWHFAPSLRIHPRDDSGCTDLSKRKDRAINLVTNVLAQSAEHILSFFTMLQTELAFYIGCLNLYERLCEKGGPVAFPSPFDCNECRHSFKGLYDVSLALIMGNRVVGNYIDADGKELVIITGANQGGKSTFLRSIGQAQLMMQCGMFVAAESFSANICNGIFTHYKREEDSTMKSGKLDEELARMSDIADQIKPNSIILFNESFSATGEPLQTSFGKDIYDKIFKSGTRVPIMITNEDMAKPLVCLSDHATMELAEK